jgi:hypothetical protein
VLLTIGYLFTSGIDAVHPSWLAPDLDQDVSAHKVGYALSQALFMIHDGRGVQVPFAGQTCKWLTLSQALDYGDITR